MNKKVIKSAIKHLKDYRDKSQRLADTTESFFKELQDGEILKDTSKQLVNSERQTVADVNTIIHQLQVMVNNK